MLQPVSVFIGLRYSQSQKRSGFISFITFFSIVGILLGVASLITVVSVMNGFEGELKKRVLGLVPHVIVSQADKTVESSTAEPFNFDTFNQTVSRHELVAHISPFSAQEALVQSASSIAGVLVNGVKPEFEQNSMVANSMLSGNIANLTAGKYYLVLGRSLASQLNVMVGDQVRIILPNKTLFTPMGRIPMQRNFVVAGIFNVGSQVDGSVVYIHYQDGQKLARNKNKDVEQARIYLHDAFTADELISQLASQYPHLNFDTWKQSQGTLFSAVKMEKNMMWLMLSLIVAVAAFNIVSALVLVVNDKQGEISILQTLGMNRAGIIKIFITQGMVNGLWGTFLGAIIGIVLTLTLNPLMALFGVNIFGQGYVSQTLPIELAWQDVSIILSGAFAMSFLATLYPAYRASTTLPAEVLRNE